MYDPQLSQTNSRLASQRLALVTGRGPATRRETVLSYTGAKLRPERSLPRTPRHVYGSDHSHVTDVPGQATVQMTGPPSGTGGNIVAGAFTPVLAKVEVMTSSKFNR